MVLRISYFHIITYRILTTNIIKTLTSHLRAQDRNVNNWFTFSRSKNITISVSHFIGENLCNFSFTEYSFSLHQ